MCGSAHFPDETSVTENVKDLQRAVTWAAKMPD